MMSKSITKNLMYNLLLQAVNLALPLVTIPYVSRILGTGGVGIFSYTLSIADYFVIAGTIGLSLYGSRQIAYTRDDREKMSRAFWGILTLKAATTGCATLVYIALFWKSQDYAAIFMIQTINIAASAADISWLFMGVEDFKKIVLRSIFVRMAGTVFIFVMIKSGEDLALYVLLNALVLFFGNLMLWMCLPRTVGRVKLCFKDIKSHLIPAVQLFIPQIAIQVYAVLDKSMLGWLSNVDEVGLYTQSEKLIKVGLALITALGTVMLPYMSNRFAHGDKAAMDKSLNSSFRIVSYVAVPMTFGMIGIADELVPWFLGPGFELAGQLMLVLSPILFFIAMSNVMGMQYLMPANRTRQFTVSVCAGAAVNLALNFLLIPAFRSLGACWSTLAAEATVTLIQYLYLRGILEMKVYLKGLARYCLAGFAMFLLLRVIGALSGPGILTTALQCLLGAAAYLSVLTLVRDETHLKTFRFFLDRASFRLFAKHRT